jgi:hypothetical protein
MTWMIPSDPTRLSSRGRREMQPRRRVIALGRERPGTLAAANPAKMLRWMARCTSRGPFKWRRAPAVQHRSRRATPGGDSSGACRRYCRRVDCGVAPSRQGGTPLPSKQCREPGWRDARVLPTDPRGYDAHLTTVIVHGPTADRLALRRPVTPARWWHSRAGRPSVHPIPAPLTEPNGLGEYRL